MPIIICGERIRTGKVSAETITKGYCPTKNMYYYGLKLHTLAFRGQGTIPFPEMLILSSAEENDLTVLKKRPPITLQTEISLPIKYTQTEQKQGITMFTPVKAIKGEHPGINPKRKNSKKPVLNSCIKSQTTYRIIFQLVEWENKYSKSDESQINIWTFSTYDGKNCHRIYLSNVLKTESRSNTDSHEYIS